MTDSRVFGRHARRPSASGSPGSGCAVLRIPLLALVLLAAASLAGLSGCGSDGDGAPGTETAAVDWCPEHEVAESECTRCHPELIEAFRSSGDWCGGHGIPESQCVLCDPSRKRTPPAGLRPASDGSATDRADGGDDHTGHAHAAEAEIGGAREAGAAAGHAEAGDDHTGHDHAGGGEHDVGGMCVEHDVAEADCAVCLPSLSPRLLATAELEPRHEASGPLLRLAREGAGRRAGIRAVRAAHASTASTVPAWAEVAWNENRLARLTSPAGGTVRAIRVDLGDRVRAGQVVAEVQSPELAALRGEVRSARARLRVAEAEDTRKTALFGQGLASDEARLEAEQTAEAARAELLTAQRRLAAVGADADEAAGDALDLLQVRAPMDGVVVSRDAVPGAPVDDGAPLLSVGAPGEMWVTLDVEERFAPFVLEGQAVQLAFEAYPGERFGGVVTAVGGQFAHDTRRLRARALVPNPDGRLKAGLYGRAEIEIGPSAASSAIPRTSIQYVEELPIVFVRRADDLFEARLVRPGASRGDQVELLAGVLPGEEVVTDGAFLLKTEVSKGSIGAGCCDNVETLGRQR